MLPKDSTIRALVRFFLLATIVLYASCSGSRNHHGKTSFSNNELRETLANTSWEAVSILGLDSLVGQMSLTVKDSLRFGVRGYDGCNTYGTELAVLPLGAIITGPIVGTKIKCSDLTLELAQRAHTVALIATTNYQVHGDRLVLCNASGTTLVEFRLSKR